MAKILLVEDDNNLREIFEMRLKAEGYTIVTAHDGEQALVVAMQEKPDLIISDVMMPKLSGFEMIETLKASPEMKNVKVIMMTALGQAEDRSQGDKLGVDKYLVKSQVTLEDFVRVTHEVLEGVGGVTIKPTDPADPALKALASSVNPATSSTTTPEPTIPVAVAPAPVAVTETPAVAVPTVVPEPAANPAVEPPPTTIPTAVAPAPVAVAETPAPVAVVETPSASMTTAFTSVDDLPTNPTAVASDADQQSKDDEIATVEAQINSFVENSTTPDTPASAATAATVPEVVQAPPLVATPAPAPAEPVAATPAAASVSHEKILQPINTPDTAPDLNALVAKEEAKTQAMKASEVQPAGTVLSVPPLPADVDMPEAPVAVTVMQPKPQENVIPPQTTGNTTAPPATTIDPNSIAL